MDHLSRVTPLHQPRSLWLDRLYDMEAGEVGAMLRHPNGGAQVKDCVAAFPNLKIEASVHPITRTVLRVVLTVEPDFVWRDKLHGMAMRWHVWVEVRVQPTPREHVCPTHGGNGLRL